MTGRGRVARDGVGRAENLVDMIKEDLVAERIAIETYREMVRQFGDVLRHGQLGGGVGQWNE